VSNRVALPENKSSVGSRATPAVTKIGEATHVHPVTTTGVGVAETGGALVDKSPSRNLPDGKLASFGG
jgi:hypothetical protein